MFSEGDRARVLAALVVRARADPAIDAAALVGSAAQGTVDRWSDIDLALGLAPGSDVVDTADRWRRVLADQATVADTLDVWAGPVLYRVFLLQDSLQVDVSFWPAGTLAATGGEAIAPLFGGELAAPTPSAPTDVRSVVGWAWLYALHARSAIARGRGWQAVSMINGLREQVIILCCRRHGLATHQGRGVDQLPGPERSALAATLTTATDGATLTAAFAASLDLLGLEVERCDPDLAARLERPLAALRVVTSPT